MVPRPRKVAVQASCGSSRSCCGVAARWMRPSRMRATVSASANGSEWSCVTWMAVWPSSARMHGGPPPTSAPTLCRAVADRRRSAAASSCRSRWAPEEPGSHRGGPTGRSRPGCSPRPGSQQAADLEPLSPTGAAPAGNLIAGCPPRSTAVARRLAGVRAAALLVHLRSPLPRRGGSPVLLLEPPHAVA